MGFHCLIKKFKFPVRPTEDLKIPEISLEFKVKGLYQLMILKYITKRIKLRLESGDKCEFEGV